MPTTTASNAASSELAHSLNLTAVITRTVEARASRLCPNTVVDHEYMSDGHSGREHASLCRCVNRTLPTPAPDQSELDLFSLIAEVARLKLAYEPDQWDVGDLWVDADGSIWSMTDSPVSAPGGLWLRIDDVEDVRVVDTGIGLGVPSNRSLYLASLVAVSTEEPTDPAAPASSRA